jgi:ABC-type branched-subunit amino acid transport system substrate-binding protein
MKLFKWTLLMVLLTIMQGCIFGSSKSNDKELVIALLSDHTEQAENELGVSTAVRMINAAGGLLDGYSIRINSLAQGSDLEQTTQIINSLLQTEPNLIGIITSWSGNTIDVLNGPIKNIEIPVIGASVTGNTLSGFSNKFHRVVPKDAIQTALLAQYAEDSLSINKVAIAMEMDWYPESIVEGFKESFSGTITSEVEFASVADATNIAKLEALLEGEVDAILLALNSQEVAVEILRQINQNANLPKDNLRILGTDTQHAFVFLNQAPSELVIGKYDDGYYKFIQTFPLDTTMGDYQAYASAARSYDLAITSWSPYFFDATLLLAAAVERASKTVDLANMTAFRAAVNQNVRPVTNGTGSKVAVSDGWATIKSAIASSNDTRLGCVASDCRLDNDGDVQSGMFLYTIEAEGSGRKFKKIQ